MITAAHSGDNEPSWPRTGDHGGGTGVRGSSVSRRTGAVQYPARGGLPWLTRTARRVPRLLTDPCCLSPTRGPSVGHNTRVIGGDGCWSSTRATASRHARPRGQDRRAGLHDLQYQPIHGAGWAPTSMPDGGAARSGSVAVRGLGSRWLIVRGGPVSVPSAGAVCEPRSARTLPLVCRDLLGSCPGARGPLAPVARRRRGTRECSAVVEDRVVLRAYCPVPRPGRLRIRTAEVTRPRARPGFALGS